MDVNCSCQPGDPRELYFDDDADAGCPHQWQSSLQLCRRLGWNGEELYRRWKRGRVLTNKHGGKTFARLRVSQPRSLAELEKDVEALEAECHCVSKEVENKKRAIAALRDRLAALGPRGVRE